MTDGRTDGQTDRQTPLRWEGPRCIQCSAVKIVIGVFSKIDIPHCGYCFKSLVCFVYSSPVRYGEENGMDSETRRLKVWAGGDTNNFVPSKNGMTIWAYAAK